MRVWPPYFDGMYHAPVKQGEACEPGALWHLQKVRLSDGLYHLSVKQGEAREPGALWHLQKKWLSVI